MAGKDDKDGPKLLCKPFHGQRGPVFDQWSLEYLDAAEGKGDEDGSYADCHLGTDPQAGLSAAQSRRRIVRRRCNGLATVYVCSIAFYGLCVWRRN